MTGTTTRRAARALGGIVMQPPITLKAAGHCLGAEISPEAWAGICRAFARYGFALDDLAASRASRSKGPAKASWHERQKSTVKALEAALDRLEATRKHGEFLREASDNYALATFGHSFGSELSAECMLQDAFCKVLNALVIIERAEPMAVEVPTAASGRARLAREFCDALALDGIPLRYSDRRTLPEDASEADLTPFEQLLSALGVHEG
jgi:hypothetical protein